MEQILSKFNDAASKLSAGNFLHKIQSILAGRIDLNNQLVSLTLVVIAVLVLTYLIDFFLSRSIFGRNYRIFVAPGVILHELSHVALCLLTGAKISHVSFFDRRGGSVTHSRPKIPVIGQILISLAPFFIGGIAIYFLAKLLGVHESELNFSNFSYSHFVGSLREMAAPINLSDRRNWVIIYLVLSIIVTMTPSRQDLANILISLFLIGLGIWSGIHYHLFSADLSFLPLGKLTLLLSSEILLLILALVFSIILFALSKLLRK